MLPIRLGTAEQFAVVRSFLQQSGFTFDRVCQRLGVTPPYEFTRLRPGSVTTQAADSFEVLTWVFVLGKAESASELARLIPSDVLQAMTALGLVAPYSVSDNQLYAPVAMCPRGRRFFVSDRWSTPEDHSFELAADSVYPALTYNTQVFLNNLNYSRCDRLLDLCSGTGVAAMLGAEHVQHAWAADVTERCTHFAEFNRQLNGLVNVTVVRGDLYDAVGDEAFDHIVAHPPYVPVLKPKYVYYDGGSDGEEITRRIIAGLPAHLRPGGTFQCHAMATDREQPVEHRIRQWLGGAADEFDVLVVVWRQLEPACFAAEFALKDGMAEEFETWKGLFASWRVEKLLDICVTLQRHTDRRLALTMRRAGAAQTAAAEADWLLAWEHMASLPDAFEGMLRARPIVSPFLNVAVIHRMEQGRLCPVDSKATVPYPYSVEAGLDSWMPALLASCNGQVTGMELFDRMRQQGKIPADAPAEKFGALLSTLVSRGILYVEEFAPPALRTLKASAGSAS